MTWLLSANAGDGTAAQPTGRGAGRVKMFFKLYAILVLMMALLVGGAALWMRNSGTIPSPPGSREATSARADDIEMPVSLTPSEAAAGKTVHITVPRTNEQLSIKVPSGVHDGSRLRLRGKGVAGIEGAAPGDLFLNIRVQ